MAALIDDAAMKRTAILKTDAARWQALRRKSSGAVGKFFYGVRTTGVYCRPECGAKLPLRKNVLFFDSCAEAERAGFRACRRCHPRNESPDRTKIETITRACEIITQREEMPSVDDLAKEFGLSRFHFQRMFKKEVGLSPRQFATALREERMRGLLKSGKNVTEAIYAAGFNANSRFYENSSEMLGMKPVDFRRGGSGTKIHYSIVPTSLGRVVVAGTERGICCVHFGANRRELLEHLRELLPRAELIRGDEVFDSWVQRVVLSIDSVKPSEDLPLDVKGTVFQKRVWRALREIPAGSKLTYKEVAAKIGKPDAVRAVARACATNSVAVVVPCHRVVRTDGKLAGYRWGLERKRELLRREADYKPNY